MGSLETSEFAWEVLKVFPIDWSPRTPYFEKYIPVLKALRELFKEVA
jgi:hypothetical protein